MNLKRYLTGLIGFPIVACILMLGNKYFIDALFSGVALLTLYEYFNALKVKTNPITWIGYISCLLIGCIHVIPTQYYIYIIGAAIPILVLILFLQSIINNMKTTIIDSAVTLFGVCYIVFFLTFIPLLMGQDKGKFLIWFILFSAWGTDTAAYIIGMRFGKHKFSKISPKKSIEGCIGGILGSLIFNVIYTVILNTYCNMNINYLYIIFVGIILSVLAQIGDFAASTVKRYVEIKDFGNLLPGHGGMLDRIDSMIFIAPFAYFLLMFL